MRPKNTTHVLLSGCHVVCLYVLELVESTPDTAPSGCVSEVVDIHLVYCGFIP